MRREQAHMLLDVLFDMGQRARPRPVTPEARAHFRTAGKEALLGLRTLLDTAIERFNTEAQTATPQSSSIPIDED